MKNIKLKTLAVAALISACFPAFAQDDEAVIADNIVYSRAFVKGQERNVVFVDDVPCYEIMTRSTSEAAKLFFLFRNFSESTMKVMGVKWFKAILLSSPMGSQEQFNIKTYYDSSNAFQFSPDRLTFFKSKNKAMVESVTGIDLIGMNISDVIDIFGDGVRTTAGNGSRYMHNMCDLNSSADDERIYFYTEDDIVTEVAYEYEPSEHIASGLKSFWGYTPVPEGWCTKGECSYNNVKIRESIPDGEVVGKINVDDGADMAEVMVLKTATLGHKYNWVKVVTKTGVTGWVYGKFVRPGVIGTSFERCLNDSIEYCKWFAENPNNVPNSVVAGKNIYDITTKYFDTCKIEYTIDDAGREAFYSIEYTAPGNRFSDRFCGLGIGDDIFAAKNFAYYMEEADAVPFENYHEFQDNSVRSWITVDRKYQITVETADGVVSRITVRVF